MRIVQTKVLVETEELRIVQKRNRSLKSFCESCGARVTTLSPRAAANLIGEDIALIRRLIYAKRVHQIDDGMGPLGVCLYSLSLFQIRNR